MSLMRVSRRGFLSGSGLLLSGCAARQVPARGTPAVPQARLARVNVSPDRVIRTTTGLRPFRPSGFVVRGEKLGEKTVIHNYGHGGSGVTFSWGCAFEVVQQVDELLSDAFGSSQVTAPARSLEVWQKLVE